MKLYKKSITRKIFVDLFIFVVIVIGGLAYAYYMAKIESVPIKVFALVIGLFLILFTLIVYWDFARPLRIVLKQIQALLAGGSYKKIYTKRLDEIGIIAYFFNKITRSLGEVGNNMVDHERVLGELEIASQLQREILPEQMCELEGIDIVAKTKPATEIGGDIFDYVTVRDKTYIYIGDATGHGMPAGLLMTMVNAFVDVFADSCSTALEIVYNVNKYIKQRIKKAMYMTMVMLCWDHKKQKMTYVGAGHEHILVYRSSTGQCESIKTGGIALGMLPDNSKLIKEQEIPVDVGDFVVLYSDGITEAKDGNGDRYGLERLMSTIKEFAPQYTAEGLNYHIASNVSEFMKGQDQYDDMTLMVIKRHGVDKEEEIKDRSTEWKG